MYRKHVIYHKDIRDKDILIVVFDA